MQITLPLKKDLPLHVEKLDEASLLEKVMRTVQPAHKYNLQSFLNIWPCPIFIKLGKMEFRSYNINLSPERILKEIRKKDLQSGRQYLQCFSTDNLECSSIDNSELIPFH